MWQSLMRKAGLDKKNVRDATAPLEVGEIKTQDLNGSVVGDPCNCCGARLIRRTLGAKFVWVGAEFCIIAYDEKRIIRYTHNGGIPSMQDKGFFPLGVPLRLKPPDKWQKLGAQRNIPSQKSRKRAYTKRFPSIVGQFRR